MILYHFSNRKFDILIPQIGERRHSGEGSSIAGKAAIWFTVDTNFRIDDIECEYRYTVEIDQNDDNLILDEALYNASKDPILGGNIRWYASIVEREYVKVEKWNPLTSRYELVI